MARMMSFEEALGALIAGKQKPMGSPRAQRARGLAAAFPPDSVPVEQRPWITMPASGQSFRRQNDAQVSIPVFIDEVVVVSFTVPRRKNGVISAVANQAVTGGWNEGTGEMIWRIQADGIPFQGYSNLISSLGSMSAPADLTNNPIRIYQNQLIELILRNLTLVTGGGDPVLGLLGGYFYPIEQEGESSWL